MGIALLNPPYAPPSSPRRMPGSRAVCLRSQPREARAPCACAWACFRANAVHSLCPSAAPEMRRRRTDRLAPFPSSRILREQISGTLRRGEGSPHLPRLRRGSLLSRRERDLSVLRVAPLSLRERRGPLRQQWEVRAFPPAPKAGLAFAVRGSHRRPQQSRARRAPWRSAWK